MGANLLPNLNVIMMYKYKASDIHFHVILMSGPSKNHLPQDGVDAITNPDEKQKPIPVPKSFIAIETFDQKTV